MIPHIDDRPYPRRAENTSQHAASLNLYPQQE